MSMMGIPNSHAIDIDGLDCWSRGEIYRKKKGFPLIQKMKRSIGHIGKNAYEPYIISIGPYHHGSPNVKATEKMKCDSHGSPNVKATKKMKCDSRSYILELNKDVKLSIYLEAINGLEKQVRSCYANDIQMDKKAFMKMLLLDGCFLINTLHGLDGMVPPILNSNTSDGKTRVLLDEDNGECVIDIEAQVDISNENIMTFLKMLLRDLLLLENQIPFFVLTKMYEVLKGGKSLLEESIIWAMKKMLDCSPKANREYDQPIEIYHLLHLCHMYFKPSEEETQSCQNIQATSQSSFHHFLQLGNKFFRKNNQNLSHVNVYGSQPLNHWLRATQYNEARIELKERGHCDNDPHSLLDIRFSNVTLTVPCLSVESETCDLFRN